MNQPEFGFEKQIKITGENADLNKPDATNGLRFHFFPEGGKLVAGVLNSVAFKAVNLSGEPQNVSATIYDESNEAISEFSTLHDGIGKFEFMPENGKKYFATVNGDQIKYALPAVVTDAISLSVKNIPKCKMLL